MQTTICDQSGKANRPQWPIMATQPSLPMHLPMPTKYSSSIKGVSLRETDQFHNFKYNIESKPSFCSHSLPTSSMPKSGTPVSNALTSSSRPKIESSKPPETCIEGASRHDLLLRDSQTLITALLAGETQLSVDILTHQHSNFELSALNWDIYFTSFIHEPHLRHALKCLSIPNNHGPPIKQSKSHILYNLFLVYKSISERSLLDSRTLIALGKYLAWQDNWHESVLVFTDLDESEWDYDIYKLVLKAQLRKRPRDILSAEKVMRHFMRKETFTDFQKTQLRLFFESNVKLESWEDCRLQYEKSKLKAVQLLEQKSQETPLFSGLLSFPPLSTSSPLFFLAHKSLPRSNNFSSQRVADTKQLELATAMMDICISYSEFEYGWSIYDELAMIDKHILRLVMNICKNAIKSFEIFNDAPDAIVETIKWEGRAWTVYMRAKQSSVYDSVFRVLPQMIEIMTLTSQITSAGSKLLRLYHEFQEHQLKSGPITSTFVNFLSIEESFLLALAKLYLSKPSDDHLLAASWQIFESIKTKSIKMEPFIAMLQISSHMDDLNVFHQLCDEILRLRSDSEIILKKAEEIISNSTILNSTNIKTPNSPRLDSARSSSDLSRRSTLQSSLSAHGSDVSFESSDFCGDQAIHLMEQFDDAVLTREECLLLLGSWAMRICQ